MKKFVWDTSALINIKTPDPRGYSLAHSLFKDLRDGWIKGPYQNILPAIAVFEVNAIVSRKHREGKKILRNYFIMGEYEILYPIDTALIRRSADVVTLPGFDKLRGADLVFACIAYLETATLITLDGHFQAVSSHIDVVDLNSSITCPNYRALFE